MTSSAEPRDTGQLVSAVCHLDADRGRLTYRGYDVNELAEHATFEQVAFLLVAGTLPSKPELQGIPASVGRGAADRRRRAALAAFGAARTPTNWWCFARP